MTWLEIKKYIEENYESKGCRFYWGELEKVFKTEAVLERVRVEHLRLPDNEQPLNTDIFALYALICFPLIMKQMIIITDTFLGKSDLICFLAWVMYCQMIAMIIFVGGSGLWIMALITFGVLSVVVNIVTRLFNTFYLINNVIQKIR